MAYWRPCGSPETMQEAKGNGLYTRHVYSILNLLDEELDAGGRVKQLGDTRDTDSGTVWAFCGRKRWWDLTTEKNLSSTML